MALASGTRLGPYTIAAPIGAGGMGEVYKARDPRLGRDVAIKVLPPAFSTDPERLIRFEQEARAAAALNHPNILAVHDIGQHDGSPYIVSELLEGETLRERLNGGALPVRKAVEYAVQIAHGLAAAHEKGITHRDLKPDNVFVTSDGRVKILDFGLAKLTQAESPVAGVSELPTALPHTLPGVVLGTIGYMAPEQVRGQEADHRSDIFSFGAILYEMLSGRRAFQRETAAETMTAILNDDPPDLPPTDPQIPPALVKIIDRCLAKNSTARFQSAGDLAFALEQLVGQSGPVRTATTASAKTRERVVWPAAALLVLVLIAALVFIVARRRDSPAESDAVRFSVFPPQDTTFTGVAVNLPRHGVSPDGRRIVFRAQRVGGPDLLWIRSLDSLDAQVLAGTEGGEAAFWSPDSRFIGFFAQGKLKKVDVSGGPPLTLCDAPSATGGSWNGNGIIVFDGPTGLFQVSASGGQPAALTTVDVSRQEIGHRWPEFLPGGRNLLFWVQPGNVIRVGSLDSEETRNLLTADSKAQYAAPGYLLFVRQGTLMAQPFDASRVELTGDPFPVAEGISFNAATGVSAFSVSENGVLTYRVVPPAATNVTWFDRSGKRLQSIGEPGDYRDVSLSPDGARAIVHRHEDPSGGGLWLLDFARGTNSRLTFDASHNDSANWSPDGNRVVFWSDRHGGVRNLYQKLASGVGQDDLLLKSAEPKDPSDWSSDGRFVIYVNQHPKTGADLWVLPLTGDRKPIPFLLSEFNEGHGRLSPNGVWMAYTSTETGRNEVYVQPFPASGAKWQISTSGGAQARWRRDGKELYYLAGASGGETTVMAVEVRTTESPFEVSVPRMLFRTRIARQGATPQSQSLGTTTESSYGVTADGQRFLILTPPVAATAQEPITIVLNWTAVLKK
ncbi:MAG: protein kinase domain-containing protein [Vicinamibacterales bacterium]